MPSCDKMQTPRPQIPKAMMREVKEYLRMGCAFLAGTERKIAFEGLMGCSSFERETGQW